LLDHLQKDIGVAHNDIVWLHSGLLGLGIIEGGLNTITKVFSKILSEGALVIPTFTYSWCNSEVYNPLLTECPDMGAYAKVAWKDRKFKRNLNPNFSISVMDQSPNKHIEKSLLKNETKFTCFGFGSVFDQMYKLSLNNSGKIILLGGAHNDVVFRSTFLHYVEEKAKVPYRYCKKFINPQNSNDSVEQLVRYMSKEEYMLVNNKNNSNYKFPIEEKYLQLGNDLVKENIITQSSFGYSKTRSVSMRIFCDWLENKISNEPDYLLN
tara:strand:+ start:2735 stop:3532 length:798 start_codon:yes stop_codon:yes gene_type:complete